MSFLNPVSEPVKVYRWDDAGAPVLDKTPNCMAIIFKACLVTGYGTKGSAGWTMPFEDAAAGIKVFKQPDADSFYLQCSLDTGKQMAAKVYSDMTDARTGSAIMQCDSDFKYGHDVVSGAWVLVATTKSIYFFSSLKATGSTAPAARTGVFFTCGVLQGVSVDNALFLHHSGGNFNYSFANQLGFYEGLPKSDVANNYVRAKVYARGVVYSVAPTALANGQVKYTNAANLTDICIICNSDLYVIPGLTLSFSGAQFDNGAIVSISALHNGPALVFAASSTAADNVYIATDKWVY